MTSATIISFIPAYQMKDAADYRRVCNELDRAMPADAGRSGVLRTEPSCTVSARCAPVAIAGRK